MTLSPKQVIYEELPFRTLPYLRNVSTWSWWRRLRDRSTYWEAQLIHNLTTKIFEPNFVEADVNFLNGPARYYCQKCSRKLAPLYPLQVESIQKLFALVPENLRGKLLWDSPR